MFGVFSAMTIISRRCFAYFLIRRLFSIQFFGMVKSFSISDLLQDSLGYYAYYLMCFEESRRPENQNSQGLVDAATSKDQLIGGKDFSSTSPLIAMECWLVILARMNDK